MGTWSHGNFDNDTALDWLADITGQLLDEIAEALDSPEALLAGEPESDLVPCRIELLCAMAEGGMHPLWPDVQTLEHWKATYLQAWEESIDELEPDEGYKQERRIVIVETFDRMIALAAADEEEGADEDWGEE
ncbi:MULTISPECIES: DUF4259 domain-containing protein [Comamonas]|jgi:hypothetical protein|uniref:DUF4259 domain-containing protein n=1 Tax=Comamonas TaxID=283 RepID=UPI0012C08E47|nr:MULTISPECIES: DUF4259 domain-containing protein [Comamonas]MDR3064874.1 DUF4259 domain-containing protein [Comamonas sp.]MEB5965330.1 DUF4259 domain-containing protein [Comamonas testosteroni]MPS94536.1 DUF4259 domain-containing protein [Comamonas sp.]